MTDNQEIRATLDRYMEASVALDLDRVHEFYHDDIYFHYLIVEYTLGGLLYGM